jgi:hypothetical protein
MRHIPAINSPELVGAFDADNDPHGHDFGAIDQGCEDAPI